MTHHVKTMIELHYRPSRKSRTWRKAFSMHTQGRANMERDAPAFADQEGWAEWKIVEVAV